MSESFATDRPSLPEPDEDGCVTLANGECVSEGPCIHSIEPAALVTARVIESPRDTGGWVVRRVIPPGGQDGIETFTTPEGVAYVRGTPEDADVIVDFTRIAGMQRLYLVLASESSTVKRAEKKGRRAQRALRARGYDV